MEFLVTLLPVALILLGCVGMHFLMMRGMHGSHGSRHQGHAGIESEDRVVQLESQVAQLQRELDRDRSGARNGNHRETVASARHHDAAPGQEAR